VHMPTFLKEIIPCCFTLRSNYYIFRYYMYVEINK
jgi:hypothetical protein